jgi:23S rRNA (adenine2503-C2)-methyltransferase
VLKLLYSKGDDNLARVFVAEVAGGARIEFVESVQPPIPRDEKWVLIVSTLKGCPIDCPMCDAGGRFAGKLTAEEIHAQIDFLIRRRFPDGGVPTPKLKVQFARMGDPALNDAVLDVLTQMPQRFRAPGLIACISTIAPAGREDFFKRLLQIKNRFYSQGRFQLQFSVHSTDARDRRQLVPAHTWSLAQMADYGRRFRTRGDRKVTLNFAPAKGLALDARRLSAIFPPEQFLVKLTPINPTFAARRAQLVGLIDPGDPQGCREVAERFRRYGYETLVSIGALEENAIGSNCGMYVTRLEAEQQSAPLVQK